MSRWEIQRRQRWPLPQGDNTPSPKRPWNERIYKTYQSAYDEYVLTGSEDALAEMLELVEI
jgi:hypothetical protein